VCVCVCVCECVCVMCDGESGNGNNYQMVAHDGLGQRRWSTSGDP